MKGSKRLYSATNIAYGVILGALLLIAICELISGGSGAVFRYQGF